MAKTSGPLFSVQAHGNLGGELQFRGNRYGGHVYRPMDPKRQNKGAPSAAQALHRACYAEALADWRRVGQDRRDAYAAQAIADPRAVSGWNLFLAEAISLKNQPRERGDIVNLGDITDLTLPIDGRTFEAQLIGDGILTVIPPTEGIAAASLYLTSTDASFELGVPISVIWLDGAPIPLQPNLGQILEVYIRATPSWVAISARPYY